MDTFVKVLQQRLPVITIGLMIPTCVWLYHHLQRKEESIDYDFESREQEAGHIPYSLPSKSDQEMIHASSEFYRFMNTRRSVRFFSSRSVPRQVIENIILTAGTSPSGAHQQPWTFVVVQNPAVKKQIREIVEHEERINYERRMGSTWVNDLQKIGTNWQKEYLETAPYLILVLKQQYGLTKDGKRQTHYYNEISVSIASGMLVTAIHNAGLATVTTTPMNAGGLLAKLLNRPDNEKVVLLLPVGVPSSGAMVPNFSRKSLDEICLFV
jgi:iodotyrosine deiodinase